ncbi:MAG: betaine/proline/choline family ABC transporter ATP-binding protein [Alicyclobacillus sp.]|nr:betaine/proline/choline family ABC transporter ATP-binding protein [Alicyclobacillus sp.]
MQEFPVGKFAYGVFCVEAARGCPAGHQFGHGTSNNPNGGGAHVLTFSHLGKTYPDGTDAVVDFNLEVARGELIALIGPSGCGKSTTLRMVNRLIEPTSGTVMLDGQDYKSMDPVELRRRLGYVIQQIGLIPHLTIAENISFVLRLQGVNKQKRRERASELMALAGLPADQYLDRYPRELSGGQQQRIGVLRALAHDPEIILMDEPFGALDPLMREQLQDELKRLQQAVQKTIIFVTHDMDEALRIADRIVIMRAGRVIQVATPEEMLRNPADEFVAEFIGRQRLLRQASEVAVREIMLDNPAMVSADTGLAQSLEFMRRRKVDSVLVKGPNDVFVGAARARDVQRALEAREQSKISAYARHGSVFVGPDDPAMNAIHHMLAYGLDAIPVLGPGKVVVGIVTRGTLAGVLDDALRTSAAAPALEANA